MRTKLNINRHIRVKDKSFVITDFLAEKNKKNQDDYLASLKEEYNVVIESDR